MHIFAITSPPSGVHIFAWPANFRNLYLRPNLAYFRIYYPRTRRIKHLMHHATRGRMPDRPYEELPSPGERAPRLTLSALDPVGIASFAHFDVTGWSYCVLEAVTTARRALVVI